MERATGWREAIDVLVIEDDRISRRALSHLLEAAGYRTAAVMSGEDALRVVRERGGRGPRLAVVDLELPGINGLELIERLRRLSPGVTPVRVTALGDDDVVDVIRRRGITSLRKPIDVDQLFGVIAERIPQSGYLREVVARPA